MRRASSMLVLALVLLASVAASPTRHLTFAPVAGREVMQHLSTHTITRLDGDPARREVLQESKTRVRYERSKKGWRMVCTPVSSRTVRDGLETADPMAALLLGREFVYVLDSEARVLDLTGYEAYVKALQDSLPPESRAALASLLDPEVLKTRDQREFESRVTEFVGLDVADGDEVDHLDVYPMPSGAMKVHARTHIGPIEARDGRELVTIRTAFDSDSAAVPELMRRLNAGTATEGLLDSLPVTGPRVAGFNTRVVDGKTLDILSERNDRLLHVRTTVPGRGEAMVIRTESRVWRFEARAAVAR